MGISEGVEISKKHVPEDTESLSPQVTIFDTLNPRSLINIVWEDFRVSMLALLQGQPELIDMTEKVLEKKVKPDPTLSRLRLRFWDEYARAQDRNKRMFREEICRGVCSTDHWDRHIAKHMERIAWLILPPASYITTMEELLHRGLERMREVLDLPLEEISSGKPNTRLIAEIVKIVQLLDQRVKGAIIQKFAIQQRIQQSTNFTVGAEEGSNALMANSVNDLQTIESQLQKLNKRLEKWQEPYQPEVIEIGGRINDERLKRGEPELSDVSRDESASSPAGSEAQAEEARDL